MANSAPGGEANDYNTKIIEEFRANQGRVGGPWAGTPMILIHHIGARSGIERVTPLACSPQADGQFAIVAANGGAPAHPGWYYNLRAHPRITVEVGAETFTVLAAELEGTARAGVWAKLVAGLLAWLTTMTAASDVRRLQRSCLTNKSPGLSPFHSISAMSGLVRRTISCASTRVPARVIL